MSNKTDDNRRRLIALVSTEGWERIGAREWTLLREALPQAAESWLRKTLVELGVKLDQPWRGVDVSSLQRLEETLIAIADLYAREPAAARKMVIAAKDKTRFAARNQKAAAEKRALKLEMVHWMLVWLGDPAMFATWVGLRKSQLNPEKPIQP